MTWKLLEIRDAATFIPALALQVSGADGYLMRRAGFGDVPMIYLVSLATHNCAYDPYDWGNRTMANAHRYIADHWFELRNGDVVDVQFILGETPAPKQSEQFLDGLAHDEEPPTKLTRQERLQGLADSGCDTWEEYRGER